MIFTDRKVHLRSHFRIGGLPSQFRSFFTPGSFPFITRSTYRPRDPIHFTEFIEDCSFDPEFSVGFELDFFGSVELFQCIQQTHHPSLVEFFLVNSRRETRCHPRHNSFYLWSMLQYKIFPSLLG